MLNIMINEVKELSSTKKIWFGILTVLIIIIIGTSYNTQIKRESQDDLLEMGVINNDDSSYSELLLSYLSQSETLSSMIKVSLGEEQEIQESFRRGELDIYIQIPEGFAQNMIKIEHFPIKVVINTEDTTKAILFKNVLEGYEKYISSVEVNAVGLYEIMESHGLQQDMIDDANRAHSLDLIFTVLGKEELFDFNVVDTIPATEIPEYYMISVLVIALMYAGLYGGFRLLREICQGTYARLMTTRTSLISFLAGKLLPSTVVLIAFTILALRIILTGGEGYYGTNGIETASYGAAMAIFCICSSVFISAFFRTTQSFLLAGNLCIFYLTVVGGGIIPIMFLPQGILQRSKLTPFYYMMEAIIRLKQGGDEKVMEITLVLFAASILLFLASLLMYKRRSGLYEDA